MASEVLKVDANNKPVIGLVTDDSNQDIRMARIDDSTKGLKVMIVGGAGSGTVTSVSVGTGLSATTNPIVTSGTISLSTPIAPIATLGSPLQSVRVNVGGTALEYYTPGISIGSSISGGTPNEVLYADNSTTIAQSSNFTFDGTNLSIKSIDTTLYADMFSGVDIGAQINAAYAALPSTGGRIMLPAGTFSFSTPIVFNTSNKFVSLVGVSAAATFIKYTPTSGNAITVNCGNPTGHLNYEITGFTLLGKSSLIAAGQTNTNTSVGIYFGGTNGAVGINTHDLNVNGFGTNIEIASNAYMLSFKNVANSGGNGGQASRGSLVHINAASNSGERNVFDACTFTDPGNSNATNAIYITSAGTASNFFSNNSFDDAQVFIGASNGQTTFIGNHFENAAFSTYPQYIPVLGVSSDLSTLITFIGNEIANDGTNSGNTFQTIIKHGGQLTAIGTMINNYGGATVTSFVDHSLDNGLSSDLVGMTQVQGGGLTNLIAGSGGIAWSHEAGACFTQNVNNSYSVGLRAKGGNTNEFFSGSTITGTYDHNANWVFGVNSSSNATFSGNIVMNGSTSGTVTLSATAVAGSSVLTLPAATDTLVGKATTDILTNKTLTTPTITKPVMSATNPTAQTYTPSVAGTATLDLSLSNTHFITMPAGNITIALSNDTNNQIFTVRVLQDATGSRTVTWFTTIKWAGGSPPTLTTTASKADLFGFVRTGSGTYDGFVIGQNI